MLKQLATVIKGKIRREDILARYGGEEFAIVLPEIDGANALNFAGKVRKLVEKAPFKFEDTKISVTVSIGVATATTPPTRPRSSRRPTTSSTKRRPPAELRQGVKEPIMRVVLLMLVLSRRRRSPRSGGQGKACDAKSRCDGELQCVEHRDGKSTCELVCAAKTKCPEDQRCVKDGSELLCRPITDGVGLATELKTPAGQGKACDAKNRCDGELQCVKHRDGKSTCEMVCAVSAKCPEDQRCVKDSSEMLCRPITDLDLNAKTPAF